MRKKIPDLTLALSGWFAAHHAVLAGLHLDHIDHLNAMIGRLQVSPFTGQRDRLMTIPGVGRRRRSSPRLGWTCPVSRR